MIVEWFLMLAETVVSFLLNLTGQPTLEQFASGASVTYHFASYANSMSIWVDWIALATAVTVVLGLWGVMFFLKFARAVLGHVPLFGGNG